MRDFDDNQAYRKLFGDYIDGQKRILHLTLEQLDERIRVSQDISPDERTYLKNNIHTIYEAGWNYAGLGPSY